MEKFLREQRLYNNGLQKKFKNADTCVKELMGIQAQLHYYGLISIHNRTQNTSIKKIAKNPHLIKSWGQRATHHIYHEDDFSMINTVINRNPQWPFRILQESNIDPLYVVNTLRDYCENNDTFTKEDLLNLFPESMHAIFNVWSALIIIGCTHSLMYVEVMEDNTKQYRSALKIKDTHQTMKDMLVQYFTTYGPATIQDFSHWSGLPQKDFMDDFNEIKDTLYCTNDVYYSLTKPRKNQIKYPIILGKFDPLLVSYRDKSWILGEHDSSIIWRAAAHVEGVIIDDTGLIATWHYNAKPSEMTYVIKPLNSINLDSIKEQTEAITAFMGRTQTSYIIEESYY